MYGLNKYKIITISFICVFIMLVTAMYTTTKNAAQRQEMEQQQQEQIPGRTVNPSDANSNTSANGQTEITVQDSNIQDQVNNLRTQFDDLARDVSNLKAVQSQLHCKVQGLYNNGTIDETTPETAFREAQSNGQNIVLVCSF